MSRCLETEDQGFAEASGGRVDEPHAKVAGSCPTTPPSLIKILRQKANMVCGWRDGLEHLASLAERSDPEQRIMCQKVQA